MTGQETHSRAVALADTGPSAWGSLTAAEREEWDRLAAEIDAGLLALTATAQEREGALLEEQTR